MNNELFLSKILVSMAIDEEITISNTLQAYPCIVEESVIEYYRMKRIGQDIWSLYKQEYYLDSYEYVDTCKLDKIVKYIIDNSNKKIIKIKIINEIMFERIPQEEYIKSVAENNHIILDENKIDKPTIPKRATSNSAGYDFILGYNFSIPPNEVILLPTGIRIKMPKNRVLLLIPRSSCYKYGLQLANTIGVVDSDYYNSDNFGHIFLPMYNFKNEIFKSDIDKVNRFIQGIITTYETTSNNTCDNIRNGGFGSTN